jgi:hypothetical protein
VRSRIGKSSDLDIGRDHASLNKTHLIIQKVDDCVARELWSLFPLRESHLSGEARIALYLLFVWHYAGRRCSIVRIHDSTKFAITPTRFTPRAEGSFDVLVRVFAEWKPVM